MTRRSALHSGANLQTITGLSDSDTLAGTTGADTMAGGTGDDIYIVDNARDVVIELFDEGNDTVRSSVTYILSSDIESLILTGTKAINGTGNALNNVLTGNDANNTLSGGAGADDMVGGHGNDVFIVDDISDIVRENPGEGTDTVKASVSYSITAQADGVENLILTGIGDFDATGNTLANTITGNAGNNRIDGGAGADKMVGGAGNDTFVVDNTGDAVSDASGIDTVEASVNFTIGNGIEKLVLTGGALSGTGNNAANSLTGNAGNNTLDGKNGNDVMIGLDGDDTYFVNATGDIVMEADHEGNDTVFASASFTLSANVETLTLTGSSGINGTGNAGVNIITGNSGANILDGGAGADTLIGGTGKDTYIVDDAGDVVTEASSLASEIDTVKSAIDYTLGSNLEILVMTVGGHSGTGNSLNNTITGSVGADTLDGGVGNDKVSGLDGDDTIIADLRNSVFNGGKRLETDTLDGGVGNDKLVIHLTDAQSHDAAVTGALAALQAAINAGNKTTFTSSALGLKAVGFESLQVISDAATPANTAPTGISIDHSSVDENSAGAVIGTLTVTDDVGDTHSFTVDDSRFEVVSGQLQLKAGQSLDFETASTVTVHVTATDQGGLSFGKDFAVSVNDKNDAPGSLTLDHTAVDENSAGAVIGNLSATDPDGDAVTFTVDDSRFEIVSTQLKLKSGQSLNFESGSSVTLHVTATDEGGLSSGRDFTVDVNDVNEAPTNIALSKSSVNENTSGIVIGTLTTTDPDTGNQFSYTADDSRFEVVSGQLVLKSGNPLDYEAASSVTIHITATDRGGLTFGKDFTIAVNNVNEAPTNIAIDNAAVDERSSGAAIGNLSVTDPDSGNTFTYSVNDSRFEIVAGQLKLKSGQSLDYGAEHSVTLHITATDQGGLSFGKDFSITVTDVPDPVFSSSADNINFNTLSGNFDHATYYDALGGNDVISLPDAAHATALGYDAAHVFAGGAGDDTITGNALNDIIDGGTGADHMSGGAGNDTFYVDDAGDVVTESLNGGSDTVYSSVSYTLPDNVEKLVLTGSAVIHAYGNALDNIIIGNDSDGSNSLDGGAGADTMIGGRGGDDFYVDNAGDVVIETSDPSTDFVFSSVSYTLTDNVEVLELTGTAKIDGSGNALNNYVSGNSNDNFLYGYEGNDNLDGGGGNDILDGGTGFDAMTGGTGADTFVFHAGESGDDVVSDFNPEEGDKIDLRDLLTGYHAGTDILADFLQVIDDGDTSILVDRDGSGSAYAMTQIVLLDNVTGLDSAATLVAAGVILVS